MRSVASLSEALINRLMRGKWTEILFSPDSFQILKNIVAQLS